MFLAEPEQPHREDHCKRIERKRAGFLQSRESGILQVSDTEQDDKGQERDQDLRARVEGTV